MRYYPKNHPKASDCPAKIRKEQQNLKLHRKIADLRIMANRSMDPKEVEMLNRIADAYAQMDLPLEERPKKNKQMELFK